MHFKVSLMKTVRWFAALPVSSVAISAIFPGLVLSACEKREWTELGHQALLLSIVPIVAWAAARWWTDMQESQVDGRSPRS